LCLKSIFVSKGTKDKKDLPIIAQKTIEENESHKKTSLNVSCNEPFLCKCSYRVRSVAFHNVEHITCFIWGAFCLHILSFHTIIFSSIVFCAMIGRSFLSFCPFSFGHCIVSSSSIISPFWYLQTLLNAHTGRRSYNAI
jgi:hypothetical protein